MDSVRQQPEESARIYTEKNKIAMYDNTIVENQQDSDLICDIRVPFPLLAKLL